MLSALSRRRHLFRQCPCQIKQILFSFRLQIGAVNITNELHHMLRIELWIPSATLQTYTQFFKTYAASSRQISIAASRALSLLQSLFVMYSLFQGLYEELTHVPERKIVLLGVEFAGKSSVLEWMKLYFPLNPHAKGAAARPATLDRIKSTVGLNVAKLATSNERLLVWDLGGAKALRSIWDRYVQDAEVIIWVVDSADPDRIHDSRDALRALTERPHLKHRPLLVLANKQDKEESMDSVKLSLALDLLSEAELRPQCVQPCSAVSGEGIFEGVTWLLQSMDGNAKIEMRIP